MKWVSDGLKFGLVLLIFMDLIIYSSSPPTSVDKNMVPKYGCWMRINVGYLT